MSAHPGLHRNFQWWVLQKWRLWHRTSNNVALQHCGQQMVYEHVTTNSGGRILIQITVDVMSVHQHLLSTSALNRRCVTIIFNHDYDRIIFRNETVNLISDDCHSYLHITLAKGIPPRKARVMAGENAGNDVEEKEVYGSDSSERHEAQEASAGDRRAIADADQAGQLDISGETKTAGNVTFSWTTHRRCEDGTQRNTSSIQRLVPILCCESRTKFSAQTSCGEKDDGYSVEVPDGLHVHSNSGREQNSAIHHIRGNAQWSGDQLHVRSEKRLWGTDERNTSTFWSSRFLQSSDHSKATKRWYHWRVQKNSTRTKRENSVEIDSRQ